MQDDVVTVVDQLSIKTIRDARDSCVKIIISSSKVGLFKDFRLVQLSHQIFYVIVISFFFTGIVRGHRGVARSVCLGEALQGRLLVDWTFSSKTIFASKQILLFMNLKRHELIFQIQTLYKPAFACRTFGCPDGSL
ncbi:unnamed protein product [Rhizophagus irregularis]|nr:unnamed protein product [Rhizophagus irregularis]